MPEAYMSNVDSRGDAEHLSRPMAQVRADHAMSIARSAVGVTQIYRRIINQVRRNPDFLRLLFRPPKAKAD